MKFGIKWVNDVKPTGESWSKFIQPELENVFKKLSKAEDLMFHTIFIGEGEDGPIVVAYGKEGENVIYLDFIEEAQWWTA